MSEFDVGETVGDIVGGLVKVVESVKVIGEPIEAAGKVIIPAVLTRVGFGAGGGSGTAPAHAQEEGEEEGGAASGSGGGGGGGLMLTPIFLVVERGRAAHHRARCGGHRIRGHRKGAASPRSRSPAPGRGRG